MPRVRGTPMNEKWGQRYARADVPQVRKRKIADFLGSCTASDTRVFIEH